MKQGRFIAISFMVSLLLLLSGIATVNAQTPTPPSPAVIESFNIENVDGSDVTEDIRSAEVTANARHVIQKNIGADFYALQIRVDIDDNTGNNCDYRINAISVTYSIDT